MPEWAAFDDEAMRLGYTVVPNLLFEVPGLSPGARYLYILLLRYARQEDAAYPSQAAMMRDLAVSRNTVRSWIEELETLPLIRREQSAGRLDVVRFLRLSEAAEGGSKTDPLSEIEGLQNLTGTLSKSDRVGGETLSESDRGTALGKDNGQEDAPRRIPVGAGAPTARAKSARRKHRKADSHLTPEQNRVRQAAVDRLHVRIREYTGLAEPPGYPDGAAAGFFAERVLAGDTEADCTDGIGAYLGRLEQQQTDAARHGRRITPHGSFAFLKSSWGSILQQITEERKRRNGIHRRAAKGAERPAAQTAGEVNGATRIPGGEAEPTRAAGAGPGAPAGAARAGARERRGADRVAAAALGEIGRRLAGGVPGGGGVGEEEADSADGGGGEAGSRTRAGPDAQGAGGAGDAEFG